MAGLLTLQTVTPKGAPTHSIVSFTKLEAYANLHFMLSIRSSRDSCKYGGKYTAFWSVNTDFILAQITLKTLN